MTSTQPPPPTPGEIKGDNGKTDAHVIKADKESIKAEIKADKESIKVDDKSIKPAIHIEEPRGWVVKLVCPSGASPALRAFILGNKKVGGAQGAIQSAVDLLGRGTPTPPPKSDSPIVLLGSQSVGSGAIDPAYQKTVSTTRNRQDSLSDMDKQVAGTSTVVADQQQNALRVIKNIVADLNATLSSFQGRKLSSAENTKLAEIVAHAVELVYDQVTFTSDQNTQLAQDPGGNGKPGIPAAGAVAGSAGAGTGAGGGGELGSILQTLAMLPMAFMPLIGMVPELLNQGGEEAAPEEELGGPVPENPSIVPVAAETTVSTMGDDASDNGRPASLPSLSGLGRTAASRRGTNQASHGNNAPTEGDDEDVTEPTLEQV